MDSIISRQTCPGDDDIIPEILCLFITCRVLTDLILQSREWGHEITLWRNAEF